jgi:DNA replication protein DnaD
MAGTPDTETADEVVRRRLAEIRQWQREGKSVGWITKQLGIARSSYQRVLPQVEAEKVEAQDVLHGDEGAATTTEALTRQVYTGRQTSDSDASIALPEQISRLLPALHELSELLPTIRELQPMLSRLKTMMNRELERQALAEMPEDYEKFIATYSVRLSPRLIEDIKAYAKDHRLSQSEVATTALYELINRK